MKRLATLFIVLIMILSFAACGGSEATIETEEKTNFSENEEIEMNENNDKKEDISFSEIVVVDNDEIVIKITGIDPDNMWGYTLEAFFENKSADKTYMYSVETAAINGVQCDPFFATEVAAGKKANDKISFSDEELDKNDIGEYTDIELTFRIYDSNDWTADNVAIETVHVYPYGEDEAIRFVREEKTTDNVIIDNEYITVIVTGYETDDIWGYGVNFFFVNKTDKNIMFSVEEASINGFMADPFYAKSVCAEKCAFSTMYWYDSVLEENGITSVDEIEFVLRAYDEDDWMSDNIVNETVILNP